MTVSVTCEVGCVGSSSADILITVLVLVWDVVCTSCDGDRVPADVLALGGAEGVCYGCSLATAGGVDVDASCVMFASEVPVVWTMYTGLAGVG